MIDSASGGFPGGYAGFQRGNTRGGVAVPQEREPGAGLDLSMLNLADTSDVFKKKS